MPKGKKLKTEEKLLLLAGGSVLALLGGILAVAATQKQEGFRVGFY